MKVTLPKSKKSYRVAVVMWWKGDDIAEAIFTSLQQLGHDPVYFLFDEEIPSNSEIVITFAPYGPLLPILRKVSSIAAQKRPILVHWDTEGIPNPNTPWWLLRYVGGFLSLYDRLYEPTNPSYRKLASILPLFINKYGFRIRLDGLYHYAYKNGLINVFIETSKFYANINNMHGLPTRYVPWGTHTSWYSKMNIERDIDVLWMGSRRSKRRIRLINRIREELDSKGFRMHIIDGIENRAVFGDERNIIFNRSKTTLNILPAWYFNSFTFRYHLAAGNRTLVVSEPILSHCPKYQPGINYVSSRVEDLVETILFYLTNLEERGKIVEQAYQLVTTEMTFINSVNKIMDIATEYLDENYR